MNTTINISAPAVFIFIGLCFGFLLSFFFIFKSSAKIKANRFQGLLLLSLSLPILDQLLNITGYITRVLVITNITEPINLIIGPFLYLFIKRSLDKPYTKKEWLHFAISILYFGYLFFDLIQSNEFKYNSYVSSTHPDWQLLDVKTVIDNDPLHIKKYLNPFTAISILCYVGFSLRELVKKAVKTGESIFSTQDDLLRSLRNMVFHLFVITMIFVIVKLNFPGDVGDYFIGIYISFFCMLTMYRVMDDSTYFDRSASFMDISMGKYRKSSLTEEGKTKIIKSIIHELETKEYYCDNLASLSDLAKKVGESQHHVSQVINEKLNKNFFELLASYRVEKAKTILSNDRDNKITIEELSEMVGYNSKSAFNNSFKKLTGKTPSEFRNQQTLR
jgi:AraC-like DNA-binding protein